MRGVIITSNQLRHEYLISQLVQGLNIVGIIQESKGSYYETNSAIIKKYMHELSHTQNRYFGEFENMLNSIKIPKLSINRGQVNDMNVFRWIQDLNPDYLVLFGSGLIKEPIISTFNNKIINLHLGLSPYYKGTATNFWPLVNKEPQCVGATIHYANKDVDSGPILHQMRPDIELVDNIHDIGMKTIIKAVEIMPKIINTALSSQLSGVKQVATGKIYRRKDFNESAIIQMNDNFNTNMIEEYLNNKIEIDSDYNIVRMC